VTPEAVDGGPIAKLQDGEGAKDLLKGLTPGSGDSGDSGSSPLDLKKGLFGN